MNGLPSLEDLKTLAEARKDENLRFRAFLQGHPFSDDGLDRMVRSVLRRVPSIDCRECGECCRVLHVSLSPGDTERLAASVGLPEDDFKARYLVDMGGKDLDLLRDLPCPFQKDGLCGHYEARPDNCRSYPHLGNEDFRHRLISVFANYAVCPIVFFAVEELKRELDFPGKSRR